MTYSTEAAGNGSPGNQHRKLYLLTLLSTLTAILWGSAALVSLFTPLYTLRGEPLQATLALTHYRIVFLGHSVRHPLLETLRVQLFPLAAGAVLIALASVANAFYAALQLQRGRPLDRAASVNLVIALLATVSAGPLQASTKIVNTVMGELLSTVRYTTSAGVVVLGAVRVVHGPAYTVLEASTPPVLLVLTFLLLAASLLASMAQPGEAAAANQRRHRRAEGAIA